MLLFDQSQVKPRAVRGALRGRITQLMVMAAYRHRREALRSAARLLATLPPEAGETTVRKDVGVDHDLPHPVTLGLPV